MSRIVFRSFVLGGVCVLGLTLGGCSDSVQDDDSVTDPNPTVEETPNEDSTTDEPVEEVVSQPFGEMVSERIIEMEAPDEDLVIAQYEPTSDVYTDEDLLAFFKEVVKTTDYDGYEVKLSDDQGIYMSPSGRFGENEVGIDAETSQWYVPFETRGFIQTDDSIIYSDTLFDEADAEDFATTSSIKVSEAFIEYGLHVVIDASELEAYASVDEAKIPLTKAIAEEVLTLDKHQTLLGLYVYFEAGNYDVSSENAVSITIDDLLLTNWDAFDGTLYSGKKIN